MLQATAPTPALHEPPAARVDLQDLPGLVGQVLGTSPWMPIDQARIDAFAAATGDDQWIHVDRARAAAGPFGTTIAHGFLTLSLVAGLGPRAFEVDGCGMSINYGLDRVRFPSVLPSGSRVRGVFRLLKCDPIEGGGFQLVVEATIEREGSDKPVCVAQSLSRRYPAG